MGHDFDSKEGVTVKSITYNPDSDEITLKVTKSIITVNFVLKKVTLLNALLTAPSGKYHGEKSVVGQDFKGDIAITDGSTLSVSISGAITMSCPGEKYTYDATSKIVSLTNQATEGDCVHDFDSREGVTVKSITYNPDSDEITLKVTKSIITVNFVLK